MEIDLILRLKQSYEYTRSQGLIHTKKEFARAIGWNAPHLSSAFKGDPSRLTVGLMESIADAFPEINREWLLTGEGEMLKVAETTVVKDTESNYRQTLGKERNRNSIHKEHLIPFYDVETTGGFNGNVSSSDTSGEIVGYIHPGGWFDGRESAAIRHVGDSMTEYPDGCVLAVREVTDKRLLVPGRNYVIETSEYRVTKRVQRGSTAHTLALYSTNNAKYEDGRLIHEPFEIEVGDIRRIFTVLGYIVNQSGEYRLITP